MSGVQVVVVVMVIAAAVVALVGLVALAAGLSLTRDQRRVRAGLSPGQRRGALRLVRTGSPPAAGQGAVAGAVASALAAQRDVALHYATMTLVCIGLSLGALPIWVGVVAVVAAAGNTVVAAGAALGWRRGRGYLAAHRDLVQVGWDR